MKYKFRKYISMFIAVVMLMSFIQLPVSANGYDIDISVTSDDRKIYSVNGLSGFGVCVVINNADAAVNNASVMTAVYSSDNKLLNIKKKDISIAKSNTVQTFSDSITGLRGENGQYTKIMVWNSDTLSPLCPVYNPENDTVQDVTLNVTTDGIYELYGKVTASAENAVGAVTYKWVYSDSKDGEYSELATSIGDYSLVSDDGATIQLLQGAESVKSYRLPFSNLAGGYDWVYPLLAKGDFSGETSVADKYVKVIAIDSNGNISDFHKKFNDLKIIIWISPICTN